MANKFGVTRRNLLKVGAGAATALTAPAIFTKGAFGAEVLKIQDMGGAFEKGFRAAFYESFEKENNVKISVTTNGPDPIPQYKMVVDTKTNLFDVCMMTPEHVFRMKALGGEYMQKLKIKVADPENYVAGSITDEFAGVAVFALALGYRKDTFGDKGPKNFQDFWNVEAFKGRRGLWRSPVLTMELALLADGVPMEQLYPLDVDRAFKSLDKIRKHVDVWWTTGAQSTQLIQSGELDLMSIWSTRAQTAIDDGAPVSLAWGQGFYNIDGWTIPVGTPNTELANKFVEYCMNAERQAKYTDILACGPANVKSYQYIKADRAKLLPTAPENVKGLRPLNADYWGKNQTALTERFEKWMLS